jgi:hypothetical protein
MAEKGVIFGETAARQIAKTVREVSRRTVNEMPQRGRWHGRRGGGSGGGHTMWFVIVDVLCPDGYEVVQKTIRVTPLYYTGNCGKVPPGRQEDGYWHVYDICSYLSGHVDEELPTTIGRATYFYPYTADDYDPPPCIPVWILSDLCAQPEC